MPAIGDRANVIAWHGHPSLDTRAVGRTLLLNGHIDTVPAGAMVDAFTPRIEDGVLWGRGACDMKAAVAAMACVLAATARELSGASSTTPGAVGPPAGGLGQLRDGWSATACSRESAPLHGTLVFAGTVDEETGSLGVKRLVDSGLKADYAVVGEPTNLRAAIAHKGACFIRIVLTGRGAHGSCPEKGVSAASYGARIVTALENKLRPRLAKRTYPLLGASTVSVGRICGGTEPNIVAERCEIDVDRRTLPGEGGSASGPDSVGTDSVGRDTVGEVQDVVAAICDGVEGLTYEVYETERTSTVPHVALGTAPDSPLVLAASAACRTAGLQADPVGVTYWTDGAHLAANGIETLILGPGDIAYAHGPNDHVEVEDIVTAARIYLHIAHALLRS
ncbi:MAG: M20/M25/M40 family metallo-hydrolase [Candidatus Bipolaricaulota bacterium]|nr:M20/M25/M40 family metallo-hydrolase [Candidatus Bipolaricaulota bacterium]